MMKVVSVVLEPLVEPFDLVTPYLFLTTQVAVAVVAELVFEASQADPHGSSNHSIYHLVALLDSVYNPPKLQLTLSNYSIHSSLLYVQN